MSRALFLDRDGTLIYDKHYLKDPAEVELLPDTKEAVRLAHEWGFMLFLVTNQSGVARGYYTMEDVHACNQRMFELLELPQEAFTGICIAPESPDDEPVYRKPSPKYLLEQMETHFLDPFSCWMVGDKFADLECAVNAGVWPIYVRTGKPLDAKTEKLILDEEIRQFPSLLEFLHSLTEKQGEHPGL